MSTLTKILIVLLTLASIFLCGIVVTYVAHADNYKKLASDLEKQRDAAVENEKSAKEDLKEKKDKFERAEDKLNKQIASLKIDLEKVKREFGQDLVLVGNVDVDVLCHSDLGAVREEVRRCMAQGAAGGGYMIASCNSIFKGMDPASVVEMFRYAGEIGS